MIRARLSSVVLERQFDALRVWREKARTLSIILTMLFSVKTRHDETMKPVAFLMSHFKNPSKVPLEASEPLFVKAACLLTYLLRDLKSMGAGRD